MILNPKMRYELREKIYITQHNVWHEILAEVYLCGWAIFCVLRELIFTIWTEWFFLLGIIFAIFRKYPVPSTQR